MPPLENILSIDLESWIHFYDDALLLKRSLTSLDRKIFDDGYIVSATSGLLAILRKHQQKATFFIVSEIYEWYPNLIDDILSAGHEVAYHGYDHTIIRNEEIMARELERGAAFINRFNPIGFRAPNIYITNPSLALLKRHGFEYSSSTYGDYKISQQNGIDEIPVSALRFRNNEASRSLPKNLTIKMLTRQIPFGSGLFMALLGAKTSYLIRRLNQKGAPAVLFIHPWQLYQTRDIKNFLFVIKLIKRNPLCLPYLINISRPFEKLLANHKFTSFKDYYGY